MANSIFKRWIPPVPPSHLLYLHVNDAPHQGGSLPHIWLGACDYSNPKSGGKTWDYGISEAIIGGTWPPPGSLWLRHLTLDPWRLCWGDRVKRSHNSRNPCLRSPSFSSGEDALRQQTHRWRSLWEEPSTAAVWLPPHEKPKPELTSQATVMFSTQKPWEMEMDCWFKSLNVGVIRYLA